MSKKDKNFQQKENTSALDDARKYDIKQLSILIDKVHINVLPYEVGQIGEIFTILLRKKQGLDTGSFCLKRMIVWCAFENIHSLYRSRKNVFKKCFFKKNFRKKFQKKISKKFQKNFKFFFLNIQLLNTSQI